MKNFIHKQKFCETPYILIKERKFNVNELHGISGLKNLKNV